LLGMGNLCDEAPFLGGVNDPNENDRELTGKLARRPPSVIARCIGI
jgi:hypothetical protein